MKKSITFLAFGTFFLILLLCGCGPSSDKPVPELPRLIIGCDDYPPYNYINSNGELVGIDIDIAREACRRIGYTPVFRFIDWSNKTICLENGEVDCLWACLSMNSRMGEYRWAGPYAYSRQVVAVLADSLIYHLSDLEGEQIAVRVGSNPEYLFLNREEDSIPQCKNVFSLMHMSELVAALRRNYVSACAGHEAALASLLETLNVNYRFLEDDLFLSELGVAFSRNDTSGICEQLHAVLTQMQNDGTIQGIFKSYGFDTYSQKKEETK